VKPILTISTAAGDLEPGDDAHHRRVGALGEAAGIGRPPEPLDPVRVMAQQVALEHVPDQRHHGLGMEGGRVDLADALDAVIGLQLHEDPVHAADMRRRDGDDMGLERRDLHLAASPSGPILRPRHR
jgi:hypothetical protein